MHDILLSPANSHIHSCIYHTYAIYLIKKVNIVIKYEQIRYYVLAWTQMSSLEPTSCICVTCESVSTTCALFFLSMAGEYHYHVYIY